MTIYTTICQDSQSRTIAYRLTLGYHALATACSSIDQSRIIIANTHAQYIRVSCNLYNFNEALSCKTLGELALKLVQCDGANLALARHLE